MKTLLYVFLALILLGSCTPAKRKPPPPKLDRVFPSPYHYDPAKESYGIGNNMFKMRYLC